MTCPVCGGRDKEGRMCRADWSQLQRDLRSVPALLADLDTAAAKQARLTPPAPGGLASERTPVGWHAAEVHAALTNCLTTWCLDVTGLRLPPRVAALYLLAHEPAIRSHPAADELHEGIASHVERARHVIDKPDQRPTVGACPTLVGDTDCGGPLHLDGDTGTVACTRCQRTFDRAELRHLGELLLHSAPVDIFRAEWATGVPASTIRRWVAEGRCTAQKIGGKLMVRVADIQAVRNRRRAADPAELTPLSVSS